MAAAIGVNLNVEASGMVGGVLAANLGAGFLGDIVARRS